MPFPHDFDGSENPYQSPRIPAPLPRVAAPSLLAYRPADQLVTILTILLALNLLLGVVSTISSWMEYELLQGAAAGGLLDDAQSEASDERQMVIGGFQILLYLVTVIVFAIWIHRANGNARALGAEGMQFTPGWAVGWYFIPIANWYKPFQAMREIWLASAASPTEWRYGSSTPLLGLWWTLWLAASFAGQISFRLSLRANDLSSLESASLVQMLSDVLDVPLALVAILLLRGIHARQSEKSRLLGLDPFAAPFQAGVWPQG